MPETEKELKPMQNSANKSILVTAIFTFFFPLLGYLYTGRYATAFITFVVLCLLFFNEDFMYNFGSVAFNLYLFFAMLSAAENSIFVGKARRLTQQKEQKVSQPASNNQTPLPDLNVQILKLAKKHGEVTLADLVIETGMPPEKVREIVKDLDRHDLMRSSNREHDGAVVYRII
ncbi:hypothetical protein [Microcoleus sp. FACHB-672]|uniref:hypothetical protein n=1 Tax=Microcoleus sp. FACHB-672 TaxID=2692825 RepID=UPI001687F7E6|nr:hypothetical protein [Microcoleus sp. FACHB-672]MBD2039083.1 hypothetical protein [Microcoleus sp. FACHB-672]